MRRPGKIILVDGHHRAVAAKRLGISALDAYIIEIKENIELGMERTAQAMNLKTLDDVQISRLCPAPAGRDYAPVCEEGVKNRISIFAL